MILLLQLYTSARTSARLHENESFMNCSTFKYILEVTREGKKEKKRATRPHNLNIYVQTGLAATGQPAVRFFQSAFTGGYKWLTGQS